MKKSKYIYEVTSWNSLTKEVIDSPTEYNTLSEAMKAFASLKGEFGKIATLTKHYKNHNLNDDIFAIKRGKEI